MDRVFNFSPGPATLPLPVLERAQKELVNSGGHGMSVMEMSHRSKMYMEIIEAAEAELRELMGIPDNYKVLFMGGGATMQFSCVPINLKQNGRADYIVSGSFAKKASQEAAKFLDVNVVASSKDTNFNCIPDLANAKFDPDADYVHITTNNTIYGTRYTKLPEVGDVPLVADASSNILSEPMDVSRFGLIYAGAQKNIGIAGVTIVVIREDLIGRAAENTPVMLDYKTYADSESMYNTPPCYPIYIAKLVFDWLKEMGGVPAIQAINEMKANLLYSYLDNTSFYRATAKKEDRSLMNVTFTLPEPAMDALFVKEAAENGLVNLKGHRSVGGIRASIYNAMPMEGVKKLVDFMADFEKRHG